MKISTTLAALSGGIDTLINVVTDKMVSEDIRNIIFNVKPNGEVYVAAYNTTVAAYTLLSDTEADWEGANPENTYFQVKTEIIAALNTCKSLKKTIVDHIELIPSDVITIMKVFEEPLDPDDEFADSYRQCTDFRLTTPKLVSGIRKELEANNLEFEGVPVSSADLSVYLNTLIATIPTDSRDGAGTRIMLAGDQVYTAPQLYFAMMQNRLPEQCNNFVLSLSAANFLKSFVALGETFDFERIEQENGSVSLKVRCANSIAVIRAYPAKTALSYEAYKGHSDTGIVLDKGYFSDVLKRAALSADACSVSIRINDDGTASGTIMSKNWKQPIVILTSRLNVNEFAGNASLKTSEDNKKYLDINFSIRSDLFTRLIFAHTGIFADKVFLYFEPSGTSFKMSACDETGFWGTKIGTLTAPRRGEFAWKE